MDTDPFHYTCGRGLYCGGDDPKTCQAFAQEGETCESNGGVCDNQLGLVCYGNDRSCQFLKYLAAGDACESSNQCSGENMECLKNTCQLKSGKSCSHDSECPFNNYCDKTAGCSNKMAINQPCLATQPEQCIVSIGTHDKDSCGSRPLYTSCPNTAAPSKASLLSA
eukprot:gene19354-23171_t